MNAWVSLAVLLGVASSAHCIGMCGPIALAVPSARHGAWGRGYDAFLLNAGRVLTYMFLGAMFGTLGRGLHLMGLQRTVSIVMGMGIIIALLWPRLVRIGTPTPMLATMIGRWRAFFAQRMGRTSPRALVVTGLLNGLLPCGMVYMAVSASLLQDGPVRSAAFMMFFGLGTWPVLFAVRMGGAWIKRMAPMGWQRFAPVMMWITAILFLVRGSGFDIPFVSTAMEQVPLGVQACR